MRGFVLLVALSVGLATLACGGDDDEAEVDAAQPRTVLSQPVTVSTPEDGGESEIRWVTVEDYASQGDSFLREVWAAFAESVDSDEAEQTEDPRNLPRSRRAACQEGADEGGFVFWYRESRSRTPMIYAAKCS